MFDLAVGFIICTCIVCFTLHKGVNITINRNEVYENKSCVTPAYEALNPLEEPHEAPTQKEMEAQVLSDMAALVNGALYTLKEDN